jgi:DNA polymerase elongation subunit (family B)
LFGKTDSRYFHPVLFESVTLTAQTILKKSVEYIETQMLDVSVIYDDTDSLFISFGDINIKDAVMIGEKIAERLNDFYAKQFGSKLILIDFQKLYSALFIGAKKRYAGLEVWAEGKWHEEPKIDAVGLEIVRSEAPEKAKQLQEKVLNMILREQRKYNEVKSFIEKERIKVLNGEDDESLIISKSLGKPIDFYDNARKKPHHVQAAIKMLERGYEVNVGDKIRYVYVRAGSDKVVEPIIEGEPFPKIEYSGREYVWKNLIEPALLRIIEVAYPRTVSIMKWMKEAKYK